MPRKADFQAAFAICAAIIGAGFASGREVAAFFSRLGSASWLGAAAASAGIGALTGVIMHLARHTYSDSFPALYGALMGQPCQDAVHLLHGLMCSLTAAAMLSAGGELGALALPCHAARMIGYIITLCISICIVLTGLRGIAALGAVLTPLIAAYYLAMAIDLPDQAMFIPEGMLTTIPLGLLYACFNAALAGSAVCLAGNTGASPCRTGMLTGCMMLVMLGCANLALIRAGNDIMNAALPAVLIAARWGSAGYYITIFMIWLAVLTTLCAMLQSVKAQFSGLPIAPSIALLLSAGASVMLSVCGFEALINVVYPLLGWICGFMLFALLVFLPVDKPGAADLPSDSAY